MGVFSKNKKNSSKVDEDILYEYVLYEMEYGKPRKGLLTKAVLESNGDDDKAKSLYLQYRIEGIKQDIIHNKIPIDKIPKDKLFLLFENDFEGYKKSSSITKVITYSILSILLIGVIVGLYLFIPKSFYSELLTSITPQQQVKTTQSKEGNAEVVKKEPKKMDGIRDKYGNLYKEVTSPYTKKIWLDRNLGASRICESYDDDKCFGDYFQWGRESDGHEKPDSDISTKISPSEMVDHEKFILGLGDNRYDWLRVQNNTLWQGKYGENNPCPQGFRIPKAGEYKAELIDFGGNNKHKIYKSFLKLPMAGFRNFEGVVNNQGFEGRYWTSSRKAQFSLALSSSNGGERPYLFFFERSNGYNVRCIKDNK